jgi:hypothetical protein
MNVIHSIPEDMWGVFDKNDLDRLCLIFFQGWNDIGTKPLKELEIANGEGGKAYAILRDLLEKIFKNKNELFIVFVKEYDDPFYRDLYRLYYAGRHYPYSDICGRMFLFAYDERMENQEDSQDYSSKDLNDKFIGSIVRRPLPDCEVGRTLIKPEAVLGESRKQNVLTGKQILTMYGISLSVEAFPYSMQDGEATTCAETTILNMLDYYSSRYRDYKVTMPSDVSRIVKSISDTRNLPSNGLTYKRMSKVFIELGFAPVLCFAQKNNQYEFLRLLHINVASGMPIAVWTQDADGGGSHSIILIGTAKRLHDADEAERADSFDDTVTGNHCAKEGDTYVRYFFKEKGALENKYIVMDDGKMPYSVVTMKSENGNVYIQYSNERRKIVKGFLSPLSGSMTMDAGTASDKFYAVLTNSLYSYSLHIKRLGFDERIPQDVRSCIGAEVGKWAGVTKENPLLLRIFLCTSRNIKRQRTNKYLQDGNKEALGSFVKVHFPKFVYVCEIYTRASYIAGNSTGVDRAFPVGEIILDATAASVNKDDLSSVIWINYPGKQVYRTRNEDISQIEDRMKNGTTSTIPVGYELRGFELKYNMTNERN